MIVHLQPGTALDAEIKRVLGEQLDEMLRCALDAATPLRERVRLVRRGCKNARASLRLLRPHFPRYAKEENGWLRDTARELSGLRDLDALQTTLASLQEAATPSQRGALRKVQRRLEQIRRARLPSPADADAQLARALHRIQETGQRWQQLELPKLGPAQMAESFCRSYRRARRAFQTALESEAAPDFHEWRKAVKVLAWHYKMFRCAWPALMKRYQHRLGKLGKILGDDHDLNVVRDQLRRELRCGTEHERDVIARCIDARIRKLRKKSTRLGQRLFTAKPKAASCQLQTWWQIAEIQAVKKAKR